MSKFKIIFVKNIIVPSFLLPNLILWIFPSPSLVKPMAGNLHSVEYYFSFHGKITLIDRSYCIDKKNIYFYRQQGYNLNALSEWDNTISDNRIAFISLNFIHPEIRCLFRGNCLTSLCCHCSQSRSRGTCRLLIFLGDKNTAWKLLVKLNKRD